jgi:replicative DNA helicase
LNEAAEEILLGTILTDNSILDELTLIPEHFQDLIHQNLYRSMLNIKKKGFPIDEASLKDDLGEEGFLFMNGFSRLRKYEDAVASVHAFKSYEQMIINQWKTQKAKELLKSAIESEFNVNNLQTLIKDLSKVDEEGAFDEFNLRESLVNIYEEFTVPAPKKRSGIPSGYVDIDNKTDGFRPGNLVIIGARPSMGKTALLLNMAINAYQKAKAIPIVFSLEMMEKELLKRMISCLGEINGMKMKNPYHYTNEQEKEKGIKAIGVIGDMGIKISDRPRQKVSEMRAQVRKVKHENPDKEIIVFIDYLTLIKASQDYKGSAHSQITEISADLKTMAKDFNCPVVCLAQLSRGVESRDDKRPRMSDLRESGSIEQDADVIMLLYRDEYYSKEETKEEDKNVLEVEVAKNRDGEVGRVRLLYKKDINKIENLYHYHKQKQGATK